MAVIETFGSPLSQTVQKQLSDRSNVNSKKPTSTESNIPATFLQTQLFNSSWINLISSVNNIDQKADERDKGSKLAERLVLSGGSLRWDGEKLVKREGIDFTYPSQGDYGDQSAYNFNEITGVKPMPGITGFRVASKNLYGTLREATVEFTVWSLPELEDIEKLYLRPGYHVIVEWGHTYGLDSEGNPSSFPVNTISNYENFFSEIPADTVYDIIEQTRLQNSGNYDAFLGIIKNFSWSFRQDGGYDCSISIISKGEILESLTVRSGLPSSINDNTSGTENTQTSQDKSEDDFYDSNLLTRLIKVFKSTNTKEQNTNQNQQTLALATAGFSIKGIFGALEGVAASKAKDNNNEILLSFNDIKSSVEKEGIRFDDVLKYLEIYQNTFNNSNIAIRKEISQATSWYRAFFKSEEKAFTYVSLDLILFFINRFIEASSTSTKISLFDDKSTETFFSFENYVNLDPSSCILPVLPTYTPQKPELHGKTLYPFRSDNLRVESNRILDILICVETIFEKVLRDLITNLEDPEEFDLITLIKTLLKRIETSLGGINEFDLVYSEESNLFIIVDRKYEVKNQKEEIPQLNVYGANSIALDLSIQTKITNKLGAQISIAAQGPDGEAQFNSSMPEFKKWNKNLIDRFDIIEKTDTGTVNIVPPSSPSRPVPSEDTDNIRRKLDMSQRVDREVFNSAVQDVTYVAPPVSLQEAKQALENYENSYDIFYKNLEEAYYQWFLGVFHPDKDYWTSLQTQGQTIYSMIASDFKISKGLPPQGIIPTVISLKIHGLGGIKIGQTFRINQRVLPKRYEQFGYIVTGIEHFIENNKWVTEIKAQTYYIGKPGQEEVNKATERLSKFYPFRSTTPTSTSTGTLPVPGTPTSATAPTPKELGPVDDNRRFWTLVAVCSREDGNPQGWADVAQSIYNRNAGGSRIGYKSDVVAQILGVWQYEPTWRYPKLGLVSVPNPQWFKIKDLQTASAAAGLSTSRLQEVAKALQNPVLQQNARNFIQGRTDFLGANQPATKMKQKVQRPRGNKFGFNWNYQPANGGTPAPVPSYVTSAKV
jgi:hypothetical protein